VVLASTNAEEEARLAEVRREDEEHGVPGEEGAAG
jgi:hypothetical protein